MLSDDVLFSTVVELGRGLRARNFTSVALTEACLERLNRIHPEKDDTFVLDFVNDANDIAAAFEPRSVKQPRSTQVEFRP